MTYKFPLESVLFHRTSIEQSQAQEMAKLQSQLIEAQQKLDDLFGSEREVASQLASAEKAGLDFREISLYRTFIDSVKSKTVNQKNTINELQNMVEKKRRELSCASKEKKVVEKLKEKGKLRFFADMRKRMQKESDELTSMKYAKKGKGIVK